MAYNPTYQPYQQPVPGTTATQFRAPPPMNNPVHPSYDASMPRDIPEQGQLASQETPAHFYNPGSASQYGSTPPQQYGTSPNRRQSYVTAPPQPQQMFGTSPSKYPSQQQHLAPYNSQPGYPPQPQPGFGYTPQLAPYSESTRPRARAGSTASYQSRSSHHSTQSKRSHRSEKDSRRKNSRVTSPRPSLGDTMMLVWSSFKGAFDARK